MKSGMSNKECLFERMNLIFSTQEVNKLKSHDMYLQEIENYVGAMITKETEDFTDEEMVNIDERISRKLEEYLGVLIQRQLSDLPEVMRGVYNKYDIDKLHYSLMQTQDIVQSNYYWAQRQYSKEMEDTFKASTLEALQDEVATEIQLRAAKHVNNLSRQLVQVLSSLIEVSKLFEELGETRFREDYTFITISGIRRYENGSPNEFLRVMRRNDEVKEIAQDKYDQMFKN